MPLNPPSGGSVDGTAINPSSIGATTRGTVTATNGNFQQTGGDGITVFVVKAGANNSAGGNPYMFEVQKVDGTVAFAVSPLGAFCNGSLSFGDSNFDYPVSKIMRNSNNALNFVVFNAVDNVGHGAFNFELGGTHYAPTSGVGAYVWYGENSGAYGFTPASGTAVHNGLWVNWTINQTGGSNGISRGIYVNPTITAAADFRGIEVADVGASHFAIKTGTGKVEFGGPVTVPTIKTTPVLFAALPAAATIGDGAHAFITDSNLSYNSLNIGSAVAGGGANPCPVVTIGGAWVVG